MSTSGIPKAATKVTLRSIDKMEFEVPEAVARQSHLIASMIKDGCANDILLNVTGTILNKVIKYCSMHADDRTSEAELRNWDAKFVMVDEATLLKLIKAAEYMKIKSLLDLTSRTLAYFTPEEEEELRREKPQMTTSQSAIAYNQQQQEEVAMAGEEGGVVRGMDMEDAVDPVEVLGADFDGHPPSDQDFFNSFPDDFDDSDIS